MEITTDSLGEVHPRTYLTNSELCLATEAGGDTLLAGKMIALYRNSTIFDFNELIAICRAIKFHEQINSESIGDIWRADLIKLLTPLNPRP